MSKIQQYPHEWQWVSGSFNFSTMNWKSHFECTYCKAKRRVNQGNTPKAGVCVRRILREMKISESEATRD